ncbi:hypothetical protein Cenrod_0799 [Candidatus Symbiobacter mobilis CR]|uniref:Uncharacterized protein n=1 Tax=Candidatus Symbiobacter mobilis CR TaxID=946483 RepID=U5N6K5_9BURK|nr:hypothetical protein Cenrod_0799 [Candidatus Symbiobacter mobilis CR]
MHDFLHDVLRKGVRFLRVAMACFPHHRTTGWGNPSAIFLRLYCSGLPPMAIDDWWQSAPQADTPFSTSPQHPPRQPGLQAGVTAYRLVGRGFQPVLVFR